MPVMKGVNKTRATILIMIVLLSIVVGTNVLKPATVALVEGAERIRLQRLTAGYGIKETEDFIIRFPIEDTDIVHRVEAQAKPQLRLVTEYFGYSPKKKIYLNVYHDNHYFQKGLRLPDGGTTLGAYYAGTVNVLSPKAWGDEGAAAEQGLYIHEFTHLIMADMASGNYPTWFTEGMALYQEYINTGFEWGKEYIFYHMPYSLKELTFHFDSLDQYLAYKQSLILVKMTMELEGKEGILRLFEALRNGTPFDRAFNETFGYRPEDLYRLTEQHLGEGERASGGMKTGTVPDTPL